MNSNEELKNLLKTGATKASAQLEQAFEKIQNDKIPELNPYFSKKILNRISESPDLRPRSFLRLRWKTVSLVTSLILIFAAAMVLNRGPSSQPPPSNFAQNGPEAQYRVRFTYKNTEAENVFLMGDFTHWQKIPLQKNAHQEFETEITLPSGIYAYGFMVNGQTWTTDPSVALKTVDNFGAYNSVLEL